MKGKHTKNTIYIQIPNLSSLDINHAKHSNRINNKLKMATNNYDKAKNSKFIFVPKQVKLNNLCRD